MSDDKVVRFPEPTKPRPTVEGTNLIIIDETWFHPGGAMPPIGFILVEDALMHYVKAYVGSEYAADRDYIVQWGAKVPREVAESIFGPLPEWKD